MPARFAPDSVCPGRPGILPSLLMCDFGRLADEIARLEEAGVPALHLDCMDGHFVPNLTYGPVVVEAIRRATALPLDVHLMLADPGPYVGPFRAAGADVLTVHVEAAPDPRPLLDAIHASGAAAGLALNPPTPLARVEPYLAHCELVLVMSVMPGFGGQQFDAAALDKLRGLRAAAADVVLEVDGGVNERTIGACAAAGAEWFVVGSGIFRQADYSAAVSRLSALASPDRC